jgi:DNA-binding CsgD family transcriptional regulator
MPSRLTSNHFVGRVGELAELELAVREASAGRPTLVLLGGDSGVGKTRLVGELEQRLCSRAGENGGNGLGRRAATEADALILRGDGVEQADGELPYAPLLSALRPLVREHHPALQDLSAGGRQQLATILPGLEDPDRPADARTASEQVRLFEALLELIDCLTTSAPLILILEDMHWADRSTRAFTAFLGRTLRQERVCLILTYRADELHRRHPLRPLLSELERLERARRILLSPFDRDELGEALADILGAQPDRALLERLFTRSEGNPLFTEELLAAGLDGRGAAPQSLRDAFLVRIERLSPDAQRLARAVAVARSADETTLAAVTGLDHDVLQGGLRESVSEQVLVADAEGRFGFRHALLREALYDDLLPGERGELHIALARELEQRCGADDDRELERASAIASHYAAAGDQPHALRSTIAAARAAQKVYAYGEASALTERALELWPRVENPEQVAGLDHVDLLTLAAQSHQVVDERQRSVTLITQALRELDPEVETARYAGLLATRARNEWQLNHGEEAVDMAERALAMLAEDDPTGERRRLLAWLARSRYLRGRFREAATEGEAALKVAVSAGDREAESDLLNTLGMAYVSLGEVDKGFTSLGRAIDVARANDDFDGLSFAYSNLADKLSEIGQTEEALAMARKGLSITPTYHVRGYAWIKLTVAEMSFLAGDWDAAREALSVSPPPAAGLLYIYRQLAGAEVELGIGDDDAAARCLNAAEELVAVTNQPQWISLYGALRADLLVRYRDLDGAQAAVQQALDRLEVCTDDVTGIAWLSCIGLWVEADRAQRARDLRETGDRRDALARARLHADRLAATAQDGGPVEHARLTQGKAELARARGRGGVREWQRAAAAWDELKRPYPAAVARWREAEARAGGDDRAGAAEAASAAVTAAEALGSEWLTREVRTLAERARLDLGAAAAAGPGAGANGDGARAAGGAGAGAAEAAEDPFGLTPRERQVLALLAEGATNRQIGAALYMAEKTASVHVSRILAKLGVQGRTQAAAVAHRLHLA